MKSRKLSFVLAMLLVLMAVLSGCASKTEEASVIKIGAMGPETGDYSMYGISVVNGAKLAAKEINAAGGINGAQIEIVDYDSKGDKTEAVNAYNRMRDQDGVVAVVGGTFSGTTLAVKEIAVGDNMPVLSPTATNGEVTLDAPNVFRACYTDPYQGATAAVFAAENLGAKKAAVLYNIEDPYSEGLAVAFNEKFASLGTVTNYEGYTKNDADFRAILTKIAAEDPDVIFLPDYIAKVGVILSQIQELGLTMVPIGGDGWDGIEADYADVAEGAYFANHYAKTDDAPIVQNFIKAYEAEYGSTPNALAALAYDSAYIMAEAIQRAGSTEAQAIIDELNKTDRDCVAGHVKFDPNGDPIKSISMIQIVGGEHKLVAKVSGN
ncbi:MAG: branched-chain amino acid transport system substrate-binding protein [Clostridiales bacterium]|jgi:branched-chain amino acid transport system substrate-binding protein|nr:branched-chain amino acid transport system substrate-binding protein [Clostridiales bacterium]MDN5298695.1 branched-chain amino acid transport system substrate-binding protein [Clostridiales bacterium]